MRVIKNGVAVGALAVLLSGCSAYDYAQRTDRVAYSAGDAVKANLESQTIDPSSHAQTHLNGLGGDGQVIDPDATDTTGTTDPATP
jgi:hypothetical protein